MNNNQQAGPPWFTTWVIISVLFMLFCNMAIGAVCLVLTLLADSDYKQGKYAEAENKHKLLPILVIGGVIVSILFCGVAYLWWIDIVKKLYPY